MSDSVNEEQPTIENDAPVDASIDTSVDAPVQDLTDTATAPVAPADAQNPEASAPVDTEQVEETSETADDTAQDSAPDTVTDDAPARPKRRPKRTGDTQDARPKRKRRPRPAGAKKASAKHMVTPEGSQSKDQSKASSETQGDAPKKARPKRRRRPSPDATGSVATTAATSTKAAPQPSASDTGVQPEETPATDALKEKLSSINLPKVNLPKVKPPKVEDLLHPNLATKIIYVVLAIWLLGVIFFWPRFLPRTTVNGTKASWKTIDTVAESINKVADDYELKVHGQGVTLTVSGDELNLNFDRKKFEDASTHRIQKIFWPIAVFLPKSYEVTEATTYNKGHLEELCQQAIEPVNAEAGGNANATVAYDEASGTYVGIPESQGTRLDEAAVVSEVSHAVGTLQETLKLTEDVLEKPTVLESDPRFETAVEKAQNFPALSIDLRLSNVVVATIDQALYRKWLAVSDDYDICANVAAIEEWTRGELSEQLDSVGKLRSWTRWDDKQCQVYDGTYGWNIDGSALAEEIASRINERSETPIEVPCAQRAALYNPGGPDWGNRYIEVDMTEQYAYMYDEGGEIIWQSECVTGNESKNDGTVVGVYAIENKKSPEKLIGLDNDGDGEPDYENDVDYWMPFYGGYGLHDAIWRDTFDYDTYLYDGSHGCVNLPYYAAANLYDLCKVGDPVVIHW